MEKLYIARRIAGLIFALYFTFPGIHAFKQGIVIVPVADLVGQPMRQLYPQQSILHSYQGLPWAQRKTDYDACPRLHQLLYHEIVDIIRTQGNEIEISIPHVFYQTMATETPQDVYWTLAKNIVPLDLKKEDRAKIPTLISYKNPGSVCQPGVVTLIEPFYEAKSGITFSAGTRFTKAAHQEKKSEISVYLLDPKTHSIQTISIPQGLLYEGSLKTEQERVADFINLIRRWAIQMNGFIPYVWGGCSFTGTIAQNQFTLQEKEIGGKLLGWYNRSDQKNYPKTGFDCSGIILRAAQVVGLPYFYKNTFTILKQLPLLKRDEKLAQGDLVWIRGHIFVVASLEKNTLFEAHAYDGGYGKIHEIPISKIFKNMQTLADLITAYQAHAPVERFNDKGNIFAEYKEVKLIRFGGKWCNAF